MSRRALEEGELRGVVPLAIPLLAAMAVQTMAVGLRALFPGLA